MNIMKSQVKVASLVVLQLLFTFSKGVEAENTNNGTSSSSKISKALTPEECQRIMLDVGTRLRPLLMVNQPKTIKDEQDLNRTCYEGEKIHKDLNKYKQCNKTIRPALAVLNSGVRKYLRSICVSRKGRENILQTLNCATPETQSGWSQCLETVNVQFRWISGNSTDEELVPNMCCVYSELIECIKNSTLAQRECHSKSNTTKFYLGSIKSVLSETVDFVCEKFTQQSSCEQENSTGFSLIRQIFASKPSPYYGNAFIIEPILNVVSRVIAGREKNES